MSPKTVRFSEPNNEGSHDRRTSAASAAAGGGAAAGGREFTYVHGTGEEGPDGPGSPKFPKGLGNMLPRPKPAPGSPDRKARKAAAAAAAAADGGGGMRSTGRMGSGSLLNFGNPPSGMRISQQQQQQQEGARGSPTRTGSKQLALSSGGSSSSDRAAHGAAGSPGGSSKGGSPGSTSIGNTPSFADWELEGGNYEQQQPQQPQYLRSRFSDSAGYGSQEGGRGRSGGGGSGGGDRGEQGVVHSPMGKLARSPKEAVGVAGVDLRSRQQRVPSGSGGGDGGEGGRGAVDRDGGQSSGLPPRGPSTVLSWEDGALVEVEDLGTWGRVGSGRVGGGYSEGGGGGGVEFGGRGLSESDRYYSYESAGSGGGRRYQSQGGRSYSSGGGVSGGGYGQQEAGNGGLNASVAVAGAAAAAAAGKAASAAAAARARAARAREAAAVAAAATAAAAVAARSASAGRRRSPRVSQVAPPAVSVSSGMPYRGEIGIKTPEPQLAGMRVSETWSVESPGTTLSPGSLKGSTGVGGVGGSPREGTKSASPQRMSQQRSVSPKGAPGESLSPRASVPKPVSPKAARGPSLSPRLSPKRSSKALPRSPSPQMVSPMETPGVLGSPGSYTRGHTPSRSVSPGPALSSRDVSPTLGPRASDDSVPQIGVSPKGSPMSQASYTSAHSAFSHASNLSSATYSSAHDNTGRSSTPESYRWMSQSISTNEVQVFMTHENPVAYQGSGLGPYHYSEQEEGGELHGVSELQGLNGKPLDGVRAESSLGVEREGFGSGGMSKAALAGAVGAGAMAAAAAAAAAGARAGGSPTRAASPALPRRGSKQQLMEQQEVVEVGSKEEQRRSFEAFEKIMQNKQQQEHKKPPSGRHRRNPSGESLLTDSGSFALDDGSNKSSVKDSGSSWSTGGFNLTTTGQRKGVGSEFDSTAGFRVSGTAGGVMAVSMGEVGHMGGAAVAGAGGRVHGKELVTSGGGFNRLSDSGSPVGMKGKGVGGARQYDDLPGRGWSDSEEEEEEGEEQQQEEEEEEDLVSTSAMAAVEAPLPAVAAAAGTGAVGVRSKEAVTSRQPAVLGELTQQGGVTSVTSVTQGSESADAEPYSVQSTGAEDGPALAAGGGGGVTSADAKLHSQQAPGEDGSYSVQPTGSSTYSMQVTGSSLGFRSTSGSGGGAGPGGGRRGGLFGWLLGRGRSSSNAQEPATAAAAAGGGGGDGVGAVVAKGDSNATFPPGAAAAALAAPAAGAAAARRDRVKGGAGLEVVREGPSDEFVPPATPGTPATPPPKDATAGGEAGEGGSKVGGGSSTPTSSSSASEKGSPKKEAMAVAAGVAGGVAATATVADLLLGDASGMRTGGKGGGVDDATAATVAEIKATAAAAAVARREREVEEHRQQQLRLAGAGGLAARAKAAAAAKAAAKAGKSGAGRGGSPVGDGHGAQVWDLESVTTAASGSSVTSGSPRGRRGVVGVRVGGRASDNESVGSGRGGKRGGVGGVSPRALREESNEEEGMEEVKEGGATVTEFHIFNGVKNIKYGESPRKGNSPRRSASPAKWGSKTSEITPADSGDSDSSRGPGKRMGGGGGGTAARAGSIESSQASFYSQHSTNTLAAAAAAASAALVGRHSTRSFTAESTGNEVHVGEIELGPLDGPAATRRETSLSLMPSTGTEGLNDRAVSFSAAPKPVEGPGGEQPRVNSTQPLLDENEGRVPFWSRGRRSSSKEVQAGGGSNKGNVRGNSPRSPAGRVPSRSPSPRPKSPARPPQIRTQAPRTPMTPMPGGGAGGNGGGRINGGVTGGGSSRRKLQQQKKKMPSSPGPALAAERVCPCCLPRCCTKGVMVLTLVFLLAMAGLAAGLIFGVFKDQVFSAFEAWFGKGSQGNIQQLQFVGGVVVPPKTGATSWNCSDVLGDARVSGVAGGVGGRCGDGGSAGTRRGVS